MRNISAARSRPHRLEFCDLVPGCASIYLLSHALGFSFSFSFYFFVVILLRFSGS
uniref:Uncharacterized protein n=1 Tax=Arundo donax TaxID=35708 RepID=A0A0A9CRX7_ARUDO